MYYEGVLGLAGSPGARPGILTAQLIHRCSHGTDDAVDGRILIRTGLDVAYRWQRQWEALTLDVQGRGHLTMLGQNTDLESHPRGLVSVAVEIDRTLSGPWSLVGGAGIGLAVMARGDHWEYDLTETARDVRAELLPAGTFGVRYRRGPVGLGVVLHAQRILDDGVGDRANPVSRYSLRFIYDW